MVRLPGRGARGLWRGVGMGARGRNGDRSNGGMREGRVGEREGGKGEEGREITDLQ